MEERGLLEIRAEIYRTSAEFMSAPPLKEKIKEILDATWTAGLEFVQPGQVTDKTMQTISQDIFPGNAT